MTFLVAWRLALLVVVAAFTAAWIATILRRRKDIVRFTDVALLDVVAPDRPAWRRQLPAALWLTALALLVVGFAQPAREETVTEEGAIVVLAIDVSLSMEAEDVAPNRLVAAQEAATNFVTELPPEVRPGLILFSGSVEAFAPTEDRAALINTINAATLSEYTAIGEAIFTGLDQITAATQEMASEAEEEGDDGDDAGETSPPPARIVVLSDGETTSGRPNADAAEAAAAASVPVDTIAFGTPNGVVVDETGVEQPVGVAPEALQEIADATGGQFYEAQSLDALAEAYQEIGTSTLAEETVTRDLSGWFYGSGLLTLATAGGLSLLWTQRLP